MKRLLFAGAALVAVALPAHAQRIVPTSDPTLYVAPAICANGYWPDTMTPVTTCGNDTTGNGTQAAPFETPQMAHFAYMTKYDLGCQWQPTIQLAAGNAPTATTPQVIFIYPGMRISGRLLGQCGTVSPLFSGAPPNTRVFHIGDYKPYTMRGDPNNRVGAFFYPAGFGQNSRACLSMSEASFKIDGLTCDTTGADAGCFEAFAGSYLEAGNLWIGNCGWPKKWWAFAGAWSTNFFFTGRITLNGNYMTFLQLAGGIAQANSDSGSDPVVIEFRNNPSFEQGMLILDAAATVYGYSFRFEGPFTGSPASLLRHSTLQASYNGAGPNTCSPAFVGSIAGDTMTVSSVPTGNISWGLWLKGAGIAPNTRVVSGAGSPTDPWKVDVAQTVGPTAISGSYFQGSAPITTQADASCR